MSTKVTVWDLPTRLFHWVLVLFVVGLVTTSQLGGNAMVWHFRFGYGVLSLLLFRLIWGICGGKWSRFGTFLVRPANVLNYLKGKGTDQQAIGHNPLGAWSVLAMLGFLLFQVGSGLFSDDEIAYAGPLVKFASGFWVNNATFYHKSVGKLLILGLIAIHIAAIVYYYFKKKDDLIWPMITGLKETAVPATGSKDTSGTRILAALILLACGSAVAFLVSWTG